MIAFEFNDDRFRFEAKFVKSTGGIDACRVDLDGDGLVEVTVGGPVTDTSIAYLQLAGGFAVGFGEPSGRFAAVDTWNTFIDVVESRFCRDLPTDCWDFRLAAQPLLDGLILDLSEEPARVDLEKGVWWTRPVETGHLLRIGDNVYVSMDGDRLECLGLALTFPPESLAKAVAQGRSGEQAWWNRAAALLVQSARRSRSRLSAEE